MQYWSCGLKINYSLLKGYFRLLFTSGVKNDSLEMIVKLKINLEKGWSQKTV